VELFMALSQRGMADRGWTALMGILSIFAGILVLAYPGISLLTLAIVLSVWLLLLGVMEITLAFRLRSVRHRARVRREAHAT
jgi:uncharacterized membrane protein HdeD (DUF308 family)